MNKRLSAAAIVIVALGMGTARLSAHPGAGILVGPDGTVYFTLFGPYPAMMIRPGEDPVFVTTDMEPRFLHHLAWLHDGRLLTSNDQGELFAMTIGGVSEPYFTTEALDRLRTEAAVPRTVFPATRERLGLPVGLGGDPFTVDASGRIYAAHDWRVTSDQRASRIMRIFPDGRLTNLAGGHTSPRGGLGAHAGLEQLHYGAMAWGPEGSLFVTDRERVWRIEPDGMVTQLALELGLGAGITVAEDGTLYVVDARRETVVRVTPGGSPEDIGQGRRFSTLWGVALGPDGSLYFKDHPGRRTRVSRLSPSGEFEELASVDHRELDDLFPYERPEQTPAERRERRRSLLIMWVGIPLVLIAWWGYGRARRRGA